MPREMVPIHHRAAQQHVHDVSVLVVHAGALRDLQNVARGLHHAFADEESGSELFIVTGRAHHHGHRTALDADFERFLACDDVLHLTRTACGVHFEHTRGRGGWILRLHQADSRKSADKMPAGTWRGSAMSRTSLSKTSRPFTISISTRMK